MSDAAPPKYGGGKASEEEAGACEKEISDAAVAVVKGSKLRALLRSRLHALLEIVEESEHCVAILV